MIKVDRFYLRDLCNATYWQRFLFLMNNDFRVEWSYAFTGWNPLYWCAKDIFMLFSVCIWCVIRPFFGFYVARTLKTRYESEEWLGVYQQNVYLSKGLYELTKEQTND